MDEPGGQPLGCTWESQGEIHYITAPEWARQGVRVGFSARSGGSSEYPYESLNLGLHVGDQPERVISNREAWAGVFSASLGQMVCCQQVHGSDVILVDPEMVGRGSVVYDTALPGYDAMICNTPGLLLAAFFADCFPLFFFDPIQKAVALAHSGWKGVMGRIAAATIGKMGVHFNSRAEDIQVIIGPGIQKCCFEIQPNLVDRVRHQFPELPNIIYSSGTGYRWDLPATIRQTLYQSGIRKDNLISCDLCTACRTDLFFSYRQEGGITGRMAGVIGLE